MKKRHRNCEVRKLRQNDPRCLARPQNLKKRALELLHTQESHA